MVRGGGELLLYLFRVRGYSAYRSRYARTQYNFLVGGEERWQDGGDYF